MVKNLTSYGPDLDLLPRDDSVRSMRDNALAMFKRWKRAEGGGNGEAVIRKPVGAGWLGDRQ